MSSDRPRDVARRAVDEIRASAPGALRLGGIDLSGTLEQALFLAMRRGRERNASMVLPRALGRIARAFAISRLGSSRSSETVVVVAQVPIHLALFADVDAELLRRGVTSVSIDVDRAGPGAGLPLRRSLSLRRSLALVRHAVTVARGVRASAHGADDRKRLRGTAREILPRIALMAAQLDAIVSRTRPACIVTFNEVGIWSRLAPAVARARGIPSIDMPHAEAADEEASEGLPHDAVAVYGPRSAQLLARAGISPDRLHQIGTLRYDKLVSGGRSRAQRPEPPRILYASQPVRAGIAQLSHHAKRKVYAAALAAASAAAPMDVIVVPHPTESRDDLAALIAETEPPPGVTAVQASAGLHELLGGALLLVTAFSQSVFDAAVAGVPAIMVNPEGPPSPVPYAQEGFAIEVRGPDQASAAAARLVVPANRDAAVERAQRALADRFGVVDGNAYLRAADLVEAVARSGGGRT